ncbi:MAG: ATP-binding protein [Promethearchaeota archaeon]
MRETKYLINRFPRKTIMDSNIKIKVLLNEWFNYDLPELIEREFNYDLIKSKKIISIVGARRSGKTYLQYQIIKNLLQKGIPRENIIYFNFEDERLYPLNGDELSIFLPTYFENFDYNSKFRLYLFLDEIQNIPYWDKWIRRIYDKEKNIKIIITGSSSKLLSKEIASSLAGRTIPVIVFPFSFKEFLRIKNVKYNINKLTEHQAAILRKFLKEYILYGGFPEIIFEKEKTAILQAYYDSVFYHDIIARYGVKNIKLLDILLKFLINYTSRKISFSKLERIIKSMGYKVSKTTLIEYANYAQNVFLIYLIEILSYNIKDRLQYPKKIYCIDSGLANAVSIKFREELWALYENAVLIELIRRGKEVYYWKSENMEVDFVIKEGTRITELIQVSYDVSDNKTRERELKGLIKAMEEFNLTEGLIITKDYEGKELIKDLIINYIPLYQWLLS